MTWRSGSLAIAWLAILVAPALALEQAAITGTVRDGGGRALGAVEIRVEDLRTGWIRTAPTSGDGRYTVGGLPPGSYQVRAARPGLADEVVTGLELAVGTTARVDLVMRPAAVEQVVTVRAERTRIEATESHIAGAIPGDLIASLPIADRNAITLALLVPGVQASPYFDASKSRDGFDGIQFAASSGSENLVLVDGADNNDDVVGSILQFYPQEAVQEFQVVTARFKAEHGHSDGGVVNMVTRSGTSELAGGGYGLLRDDSLNARTFVEEETGAGKANFRQTVLGGYLGGPIAPDRAFYFADVDRTDRPQHLLTTTGGALPQVDAQGQVPQDVEETLLVAKLNAHLPGDNLLTARYAFQDDSKLNLALTARDGVEHGGRGGNRLHAFLVKDQTVLGAGALNQLSYQFSAYENRVDSHASGTDLERRELLVGDSALGHNIDMPQLARQHKHQLLDSFSWRMNGRGGHDLKAGFEWQHVRVHGSFGHREPFAQFVWGAEPEFIVGLPAAQVTTFNGLALDLDVANDIFSLYLQDDWKPIDRLTFNLGLRWDVETNDWLQSGDRHPSGRGSGRTYVSSSPLFFGAQPSTDTDNWAPRVGAAYDPRGDGRLVVRGGFGVYYQQVFANSPARNNFFEGPQLGVGFFAGPDVTFRHTDPFCAPSEPRRGCIPVPPQPGADAASFVGQDFTGTVPGAETPSTGQASAGVAALLAEGWGLEVDYLHTRSDNQLYRTWRAANRTVNGHDVSSLGLRATVNAQGAEQRYHGLLVSLRGRLERLTAQVSYSYGRARGHVTRQTSRLRVDDEAQFDRNFGPHEASRDQLFAAAVSCELPRGFQVGAVAKLQSGFHFTPVDPTREDSDGDGASSDEIAGGGRRGAATGDGFHQVDLRVSKRFRVGGMRPQVFFEVFNLFDTRNEKFDSVVTNVNSPGFATSLQVAGQGRQAQLSLRIDF